MVRRYVPQSNWMDEDRLHTPSCTVIEAERSTQWSGLYDAGGNKLMVINGFDPFALWVWFYWGWYEGLLMLYNSIAMHSGGSDFAGGIVHFEILIDFQAMFCESSKGPSIETILKVGSRVGTCVEYLSTIRIGYRWELCTVIDSV